MQLWEAQADLIITHDVRSNTQFTIYVINKQDFPVWAAGKNQVFVEKK